MQELVAKDKELEAKDRQKMKEKDQELEQKMKEKGQELQRWQEKVDELKRSVIQ